MTSILTNLKELTIEMKILLIFVLMNLKELTIKMKIQLTSIIRTLNMLTIKLKIQFCKGNKVYHWCVQIYITVGLHYSAKNEHIPMDWAL